MKALMFSEYGLADVLKYKSVEKPIPTDNEVLVKVHAASINSWDWELLRGIPFANRLMAGLFKPTKITIPGCDIAGQVEAVGKNIKRFKPGDPVFGDLSGGGWGGFAEYTCARESELAIKPAGMSFEQAAAIPQAGLLALQALRKGKIQSGQKVLINGASGGSGTFAVQIAHAYGAEVTGVCSTRKMDFVSALGADHVIDYSTEDFTWNGQHYNLIIDAQAFHSLRDYRRALASQGTYIIFGGAMPLIFRTILLGPLISLFSKKEMRLLIHKPCIDDLATMSTLFDEGKVTPVIDKIFTLSEGAEAMRYYGAGKAKGKVVISMV
jgi:NADPH:quinone reductase-like Zn-dependent oxidoreductase